MESIKKRLDDQDAYIIVGIGGDSGSGKTTLSNGIRRLLGNDLVSGFSMDDYHLEDRETRKRTGNLPIDPAYNDLDLLADHLVTIRKGKEVIKPVYNHSTGRFDPQVLFVPKRVTIVEGLHPFHTDRLRELMDLSIFVDPDREVKWKWKLERDMGSRGYEKDVAQKEMLDREPLYELYVKVQRVYSEVIVEVRPSRYSDEKMTDPQVRLLMGRMDLTLPKLDMTLDMSGLITGVKKQFLLELGTDHYFGRTFNIVTIDGLFELQSIERLEQRILEFTGLEGRRIFDSSEGLVNPAGVAQLLITWRFLEKLHCILSDLERQSVASLE